MGQVEVSEQPALGAPRARRASALQRREALEGFLWISPWIIGFLVFTAGPMLVSLYLSFTRYKIGATPEWIGLENYQQAFFIDPLFWPSLARTIVYSVVLVSVGVCLSLLAALLLNQPVRGRGVFRALFYLPSLTPVMAQAVIWGWLFQPSSGWSTSCSGASACPPPAGSPTRAGSPPGSSSCRCGPAWAAAG